MRSLVFLSMAIGLMAGGCATSIPEIEYAVQGRDFNLSHREDAVRGRFDVVLTSNSKRPMCMSPPSWPSRSGRVSGGGDRTSLRGDNGVVAAIDTDFGYCIGPTCTIHVAPGQSVSGFIDYAAFGGRQAVEGLRNRSLDFRPNPYFCRS